VTAWLLPGAIVPLGATMRLHTRRRTEIVDRTGGKSGPTLLQRDKGGVRDSKARSRTRGKKGIRSS